MTALPEPAAEHLIEMHELTRVYDLGPQKIFALNGVDLIIQQGEYVAIMGPSGSGKSTLMNIIGCLDTPTSGRYLLDGVSRQPMMFISVDFPDPEGPMIATYSPRSRTRSIPSRA